MIKSDRTDVTKATEGEVHIDNLDHEYHYGTGANSVIKALAGMAKGADDDVAKLIAELMMTDTPNSRRRLRSTAGTAQLTDDKDIDVLSTTARSHKVNEDKAGMNFILSMLENQLKGIEVENEVPETGGAKTFAEITVNAKKITSTLSSIIKLNNLDKESSKQLEKYLSMGDYGEKVQIRFSLYKILGGLKKMASLNVMKLDGNKRMSATNKTVTTHKPTQEHSVRLLKQRHQNPPVDFENSIHLLTASSKINFNDTHTINKKFKVKKLSLSNIHMLHGSQQHNAIPKEDEDSSNIIEMDVIEVHQFPMRIPLRFDKLSSYSLFFLKKFVMKKIVNAYVHEMKKSYVEQTAFVQKFQSLTIIEKESNSEQHRKILEEECMALKREKNFGHIKSINQMNFKFFSFPKGQVTDTDLLKATVKADGVLGQAPMVMLKANKYYKKKKTTSKKYALLT